MNKRRVILSLISRENVFDIDQFFHDSWPQLVEPRAGNFFTRRVNIKASFKDGVLTLEAAKIVEKEQERRRISVG
jgi:hypothetical protein